MPKLELYVEMRYDRTREAIGAWERVHASGRRLCRSWPRRATRYMSGTIQQPLGREYVRFGRFTLKHAKHNFLKACEQTYQAITLPRVSPHNLRVAITSHIVCSRRQKVIWPQLWAQNRCEAAIVKPLDDQISDSPPLHHGG